MWIEFTWSKKLVAIPIFLLDIFFFFQILKIETKAEQEEEIILNDKTYFFAFNKKNHRLYSCREISVKWPFVPAFSICKCLRITHYQFSVSLFLLVEMFHKSLITKGLNQRRIWNPVEHLRCSFFTTIVDGFQPLTIFTKKQHLIYSTRFYIRLYKPASV